MAGKEVVQLYYSAPQGLLKKPAGKNWVHLRKPILQPWRESYDAVLDCHKEAMASYDDLEK